MSNLTLPAAVLAAAERDPAHIALVDGPTGAEVTYGTLADRIGRVAATLAARGFGPGEVLALWAPNMPPWAGVALGAMAAGGAVTGLLPAATEREAAAQIAAAGARFAVTTGRAAPAPDVLTIGPELLAARPARLPAPDPGAVALLPYSSGTTGLPKGVRLTHRNLLASAGQLREALGLRPDDVVLAVAPFCHVMGFAITLAGPLTAGATVVTMPRFALEPALALVARRRITVLIVPPPVMAALARHPAVDRHDLSSLELIVSGGAPLGAGLQRAVAARLPHAAVGQGYGLTETAGTIAGPHRRVPGPAGSVGRPMAGTEIRVVDGELWVRGPQVMAGYLDATGLTPDGWLRTGDAVRQDPEGHLFVVDRLKELIKVNAFQVAPAELEALLIRHPQVADAAVIRRPDPRTGEAPVAVVVPRGALRPDALVAWVAERVAPHKRIRGVHFTDALPRTPTGKLLRRELAARYADASAATAA